MNRGKHLVSAIGLALCAILLLSGCDLIMGLFGGGNDQDPIAIPDSESANPAYSGLETDVFDAVNADRTDHSAAAFASRDSSLDALARRYAKVGACDTVPKNLEDRVKSVLGSCSEAAYFLFSSMNAPSANTMMTSWLSNTGGQIAMRNAAFTKIGIGIVDGAGPNGVPGTYVNTIVLLAKP
ncbi:MAG TPA: hypothetical protein VIO60_03005 [Rectinemataceae bacterium]